MSQKRSSRKEPAADLSAELDDMLAAPALRPSLRFLGFEDEPDPTRAVSASPAVVPIRLTPLLPFPGAAQPDVTTPPAVTPSPAVTTSPAVTESQEISSSPADTASPGVIGDLDLNTSPAVTATPAVNRSTINPKKRIHRCIKVQDGHSHVEQAVYQILWNSGAAQPDGNRISRIGLPRIAKEACVHERNIGIIIRRLIQKKSIEIAQREVSDLRASRIYKVFGYREILERRRKAGLEWVVRGRGVEFVNADTGVPLLAERQTVTAGDAVTALDSLAVTAPESPAITAPPSPAVKAGLLGKVLLEKKTEETSSSGTQSILAALCRYADADDEAAELLIQRCRIQAPDCTDQEILHFLHRKGELLNGANIANPTGFLLTAVPKCFAGETFRLYREEELRKRAQAETLERQRAAELQEWRAEQEQILADPQSSEEDRHWARKLLGGN